MAPLSKSSITEIFTELFQQLLEGQQELNSPTTQVLLFVTPVLTLVVGATLDPQGWCNNVLYASVDILAFAWPSTPEGIKIYSILSGASSKLPAIGYSIIVDTVEFLGLMLGFISAVKLYKLLPFKMS